MCGRWIISVLEIILIEVVFVADCKSVFANLFEQWGFRKFRSEWMEVISCEEI
jgi:hypothetical protein